MRPAYERQLRLLIQVLPHVATESGFALKGGTAINLFVRDLPRLSVDIDLTYLRSADRAATLSDIETALARISERLRGAWPNVSLTARRTEGSTTGLLVSIPEAQIKIEVNPVLRGTVFDPIEMEVREPVAEKYGFAAVPVVSFNDLYAGKICAALDRQHPRDFFDVKLLLDNEGLSRDLFRAFLVYLISHGRPMAELLSPHWRDISQEYKTGFDGMTAKPIKLEELTETGPRLLSELRRQFTDRDKAFLLSIKRDKPDWSLLGLKDVDQLPAVQWKLINIRRMDGKARTDAIRHLESVLAAM